MSCEINANSFMYSLSLIYLHEVENISQEMAIFLTLLLLINSTIL